MKFHVPSYLLGVASAVTVMTFPKRFRPVVVEAASFGELLLRTGRTLIARQRESFEDLWAEIRERAADRMKRSYTNGPSRSAESTPGAQSHANA